MLWALKNCKVQYMDKNRDALSFTGNCTVTGKETTVVVPMRRIQAYKDGALLQDAFPCLTAGEREFLKTGISVEGWKQLFGE